MAERFHKPARIPNDHFEYHVGGEDPAVTLRRAHESAAALLARARNATDEGVVERLLTHTDEHGLDLVAQLWAAAGPHTLPGALWRLYLLRAAIREDPSASSLAFRTGSAALSTIDPVVAGAADPTGPDELSALADEILRGVFQGDLGIALERASAYCRICAAGWVELADARDPADPQHATALTARAARFDSFADDLDQCARLERREALV